MSGKTDGSPGRGSSGRTDTSGVERREAPVIATTCDLCGFPVIDRHCKVQCSNCGYQRDCSDP